MSNIQVPLPDELREFVQAQAAAGGYDDPGAYVREVLRALWKEKAKADLEAKLLAAMESGPAMDVTPQFWADLKARVRQRHPRAMP